VIYKSLYYSDESGTDIIWVRPLNNFSEKVKVGKLGRMVPRFKFQKGRLGEV
jgi:hypothetical protein